MASVAERNLLTGHTAGLAAWPCAGWSASAWREVIASFSERQDF